MSSEIVWIKGKPRQTLTSDLNPTPQSHGVCTTLICLVSYVCLHVFMNGTTKDRKADTWTLASDDATSTKRHLTRAIIGTPRLAISSRPLASEHIEGMAMFSPG